jgi:hypothetical protein
MDKPSKTPRKPRSERFFTKATSPSEKQSQFLETLFTFTSSIDDFHLSSQEFTLAICAALILEPFHCSSVVHQP